MKPLILTLCLISTFAAAQVPARRVPVAEPPPIQGDTLPENYVLKLVVHDKEQQITELSVVVASSQVRADALDPVMTISGTLVVLEDGVLLFRYALGTEVAVPTQITAASSSSDRPVVTNQSIQYKSSSVQASVRLRLGEPVQILKSGTRTYQLTVSRLADSAKEH
jgi:hypothetical protein